MFFDYKTLSYVFIYLAVDYMEKLNLRFKRNEKEEDEIQPDDSDSTPRIQSKRSSATNLEREIQRDVEDLGYKLK